MSRDTGGPAFPVHPEVNTVKDTAWIGMTLRDYFAAKAMQALLGCAEWRANLDDENNSPSEFTAFSAYEMADAMLKARNQ